METYNEYVMVTNWDKVDADDFYLTDEDWIKNNDADGVQNAKKLQAAGKLFYGYIVPAVHYVIYRQMDAGQIYIDEDGNEIMSCGSEIISNKHESQFEYSY